MTLAVQIVSAVATCTGVLLQLGPAPDARRMLREKSTGVTPLVPLVAMFSVGWVWATYGILHSDIFPLAVTNALGVVFTSFYITVYYRFTPDKPYAHKVLAGFALAIVALTVYAALGFYGHTGQSRAAVTTVMGYIGNVVVFVFYVAPFEKVVQVFRHRSGVFIPINIVVANLFNCAAWLTYSLLVTDYLILVPNASAIAISGFQIAVYVYFHPSTHPLVGVPPPSPDLEAAAAGGDVVAFKAYAALKSPAETAVRGQAA